MEPIKLVINASLLKKILNFSQNINEVCMSHVCVRARALPSNKINSAY